MVSPVSDHIITAVLGITIAGIVGFFSGRVGIAEDLGERPTRQEMREILVDYQDHVVRELDGINRQLAEHRKLLLNIARK